MTGISFKIYNDDCIFRMKKLIKKGKKVGLVLADPPYGLVKNMELPETKNFIRSKMKWDNIIPPIPMFDCIENLLLPKRNALIFCDQKYSFELYNNQVPNLSYIYSYVWLKNEWGNHYLVNKAPLVKTENIMCFQKRNDTKENSELRSYSKYIFDSIGLSKKKIMEDMGNQKIDHFFRFNSLQFGLPTREAYLQLSKLYDLESLEGYLTYNELKNKNNPSQPIFNKGENKHKTNVLSYKKPKQGSVHPTQKPVPLLEDLITTYTNKGDTVLDFCMGGGLQVLLV